MSKKLLFVLSLLLGAFLSLSLLAKPTSAGGCETITQNLYTAADSYQGHAQGCGGWYYYYQKTSWRLQRVNGVYKRVSTTQIMPASFEYGPQLLKTWWGEATNAQYWNAQGYDWMMLSRYHSTGGDSETPILYWQAPVKGTAKMIVTDQKIDFSLGNIKGNGYKFGIGWANQVGNWNTTLKQTTTFGGDKTFKTLTQAQEVNAGDTLFYFKNALGWAYGDGASYSVKVEFTPAAPVFTNYLMKVCESTSCSNTISVMINGQNFGPDLQFEAIGANDGVHYTQGKRPNGISYIVLTGLTGTTQRILDLHDLPCQTYTIRLFYYQPQTPSASFNAGSLGSCPRG